MPKMIVSINEVVIKEVPLTKDRTTLGRRPYNDIVIDSLAVSGEHAVLLISGGDVFLEDLGSTNGTYINGKAVKRQQLHNGDAIEVGKYTLKFEAAAERSDTTVAVHPQQSASPADMAAAGNAADMGALPVIRVLSGAAAGRELSLTKVVTTIGKPGVAVAAITRRQEGYVVHHVNGAGNPTLNGAPIGSDPMGLKNGDLLELAGTQMQFVLGL